MDADKGRVAVLKEAEEIDGSNVAAAVVAAMVAGLDRDEVRVAVVKVEPVGVVALEAAKETVAVKVAAVVKEVGIWEAAASVEFDVEVPVAFGKSSAKHGSAYGGRASEELAFSNGNQSHKSWRPSMRWSGSKSVWLRAIKLVALPRVSSQG